MSKLNILKATYRIVPPIFLGGANPNDRAELRPPSIKGALRFWYRAIDPDYRQQEARVFGGAGKAEGQAMFLLHVTGPREGKADWPLPKVYCGFDAGQKNGMRYLYLFAGEWLPVGGGNAVDLSRHTGMDCRYPEDKDVTLNVIRGAWVPSLGAQKRYILYWA